MAFHHQYHHHSDHFNSQPTTTTATTTCCYRRCTCQCPPPLPPPPPPLSTDPFLVAAIVSHLLQNPHHNPQNLYTQPFESPTNQPKQKYPHRESHQFQFQHFPHSVFSSLLQRIDALEASLRHLSSSPSSFSLRDAAARTIQTHFRAYLVRRSRTLRQLKHLASIKSTLTSLKSSFSLHGFVDFDSLSHRAMDLLLKLDSIQSGDQMIGDNKRSITREIIQFLELIDGACAKRHQDLTKTKRNMRLARNDSRSAHERRDFSERGVRPKCRNDEKILIANLRERVERIGRISRVLQDHEEEDAESERFKHGGECDEDGDIIGQLANNYHQKSGVPLVKKHALSSNPKKRVCFVEDGNVIRVYDIDGDARISADVDEIEDSTKGGRDEVEVHSDGEQSSQSSEDKRKCASEENGHDQGGEFTFCAPEPVRMDPRAEAAFMTRKSGVKTAG